MELARERDVDRLHVEVERPVAAVAPDAPSCLVLCRDEDETTTAFRYAQKDRIGVFYWIDGGVGYALSGELPREQLLKLATTVYRQLNP